MGPHQRGASCSTTARVVYAARDAEGNDAGALHGVSKSGEEFVLPELNL